MNRQQKIAWFNIVILAFSLLLSSTAVIWMALVLKAGFTIGLSGFGFLGVCLLHLLGPVIFRKKQQPGKSSSTNATPKLLGERFPMATSPPMFSLYRYLSAFWPSSVSKVLCTFIGWE